MATRQSFIAANLLAGSLAALAAAAPARANSPSPSPAPKETIPPLEFDLAAFDAAAARPASHRHMFATTKVAGGVVLHAVQNTLDAYALLKEPLGAVTTAVVLYHGASITMAFDDAIWKELIV
ncbi:MAG TPA: hypothetical protein VNG31_05050, partial [Candidatus Baltobacteraceae bacterium]|nr:hypothetical protein [Candidatus Baltobacteraceae bacterium]